MPRKVLVPTDGSPLSKDALEHAIATFPDGEITLVHVTNPLYTDTADDEQRADRI